VVRAAGRVHFHLTDLLESSSRMSSNGVDETRVFRVVATRNYTAAMAGALLVLLIALVGGLDLPGVFIAFAIVVMVLVPAYFFVAAPRAVGVNCRALEIDYTLRSSVVIPLQSISRVTAAPLALWAITISRIDGTNLRLPPPIEDRPEFLRILRSYGVPAASW
jgi:hypothetical protein